MAAFDAQKAKYGLPRPDGASADPKPHLLNKETSQVIAAIEKSIDLAINPKKLSLAALRYEKDVEPPLNFKLLINSEKPVQQAVTVSQNLVGILNEDYTFEFKEEKGSVSNYSLLVTVEPEKAIGPFHVTHDLRKDGMLWDDFYTSIPWIGQDHVLLVDLEGGFVYKIEGLPEKWEEEFRGENGRLGNNSSSTDELAEENRIPQALSFVTAEVVEAASEIAEITGQTPNPKTLTEAFEILFGPVEESLRQSPEEKAQRTETAEAEPSQVPTAQAETTASGLSPRISPDKMSPSQKFQALTGMTPEEWGQKKAEIVERRAKEAQAKAQQLEVVPTKKLWDRAYSVINQRCIALGIIGKDQKVNVDAIFTPQLNLVSGSGDIPNIIAVVGYKYLRNHKAPVDLSFLEFSGKKIIALSPGEFLDFPRNVGVAFDIRYDEQGTARLQESCTDNQKIPIGENSAILFWYKEGEKNQPAILQASPIEDLPYGWKTLFDTEQRIYLREDLPTDELEAKARFLLKTNPRQAFSIIEDLYNSSPEFKSPVLSLDGKRSAFLAGEKGNLPVILSKDGNKITLTINGLGQEAVSAWCKSNSVDLSEIPASNQGVGLTIEFDPHEKGFRIIPRFERYNPISGKHEEQIPDPKEVDKLCSREFLARLFSTLKPSESLRAFQEAREREQRKELNRQEERAKRRTNGMPVVNHNPFPLFSREPEPITVNKSEAKAPYGVSKAEQKRRDKTAQDARDKAHREESKRYWNMKKNKKPKKQKK